MKIIPILNNNVNSKSGVQKYIVPLEKWDMNDVDYLLFMGFYPDEINNLMTLDNPVEMNIFKIEKDGISFFVLEEKEKSKKFFDTFKQIVNYFDNYNSEYSYEEQY